ncbi:MAG: SDR family NAD(P)-dependent oxidoreductase [Chloroflexi bacterium]|nr:SDR family NAD(P)-dependent oxidoreductase [Chloroflexota bacterium]
MKHTLITGASVGIGKALAYEFASKGRNLILVARRVELLEIIKKDIAAKYDVDVVIKKSDLSREAKVLALYEASRSYEIDTFINNAGLGDYSYSWDMDIEKAIAMVDLNIKALMTLSLMFIKDYKDKDATLINISSGGGYFVFNKAVTYCATKFFVSSFTEGIAQNLQAQNKKLRVKVLAPGGTESDFIKNAEEDTGFKGADIFDSNSFISAEKLAEYAYQLYESDKILGIVHYNKEFELKNPIFPYGG